MRINDNEWSYEFETINYWCYLLDDEVVIVQIALLTSIIGLIRGDNRCSLEIGGGARNTRVWAKILS